MGRLYARMIDCHIGLLRAIEGTNDWLSLVSFIYLFLDLIEPCSYIVVWFVFIKPPSMFIV